MFLLIPKLFSLHISSCAEKNDVLFLILQNDKPVRIVKNTRTRRAEPNINSLALLRHLTSINSWTFLTTPLTDWGLDLFLLSLRKSTFQFSSHIHSVCCSKMRAAQTYFKPVNHKQLVVYEAS